MNSHELAFMKEFWEATSHNPINPKERIVVDKVGVECLPFDNRIHISSIRSLDMDKGFASFALNVLCGLADKYQLELGLSAIPIGKKGLNQQQLIDWYVRHGFVVVRETQMRRKPLSGDRND